jgi:hypothetical protein
MFRLVVVIIAVVGVVISLALGFSMLVPWEVSSILATAFIGIPSLFLAYLSLKEKKNVKETKSAVATPVRLEQAPRIQTILEETLVLDGEEYFVYGLGLENGEELKGEISSDGRINFFLLTKYGLTRFENNEDFSYDYGSESILESKVSFTALKTGTLYLVIENEGEDKATVTLRLFI